MEYTVLGRTGLRVSRIGLGCGGHSRLGLASGKTDQEAAEVVREAFALGINFTDTAESYRTETAVGVALKGVPREMVVVSTKVGVGTDAGHHTPGEYRKRIEACLARLGTDYIDVFNVHGLSIDEYDYARTELVPVIQKMRDEGKVRFVGVTESFIHDTSHKMLSRALRDDCWDVMMVGFSVLNQSARKTVFPYTMETGVGTLCMFAVRRALSQPHALKELMDGLVASGEVDAGSFDPSDPLGFMVGEGVAPSIIDAAYRFCRYELGINVVLSGTGSVEHLRANAASLMAPPLPEAVVEKAKALFARVDSVSGN